MFSIFFRSVFFLLTMAIFTMVSVESASAKAQQPSKASKTIIKKQAAKVTKTKRSSRKALSPARRSSAIQPSADRYAALVVNAATGQVLYEVSAGATRHPASLTKMMTLYLLFDALKRGKVTMDTLMPVSEKAARAAPTNINLTEGDRITVRTAIESLVVRSANDSAMVVAEAIGGSQDSFAELMNRKARQLGMANTKFYNPSGLPDARQITTAYDMARLGIALRRDFPEYYRYFSLRDFTFRGQQYTGHNRLLGRYPGADGIKTGFIGMSGFNLVTSVRRGNTRLVGVILGGNTAAWRDRQMMDMLDRTFASLAGKGRQLSDHAPKPDNDQAAAVSRVN